MKDLVATWCMSRSLCLTLRRRLLHVAEQRFAFFPKVVFMACRSSVLNKSDALETTNKIIAEMSSSDSPQPKESTFKVDSKLKVCVLFL
jgi:hypothetical protein